MPNDLAPFGIGGGGYRAKIAVAYQRAIGQGTRTRLIGRARGYNGVGFGGITVGGILPNRRIFPLLPGADHLPHTYSHAQQAFGRGQPAWRAHLADELEAIVSLHGADTISAVIVEPMAGSTGVLVPPAGYLERLREIATRHGILLIFDEVITGFGRTGAAFAADRFGVTPDLITVAKGLTNGAVPMGAVGAANWIYDAVLQGPRRGSSCSTATPIPATRSPAPPASPRWISTATKGCSSARRNWRPIGRTRSIRSATRRT